mmetsp:Transcript_30000/g.54664  ORF Transcript_30000/g.54664 Transcript_30000/m.54664 type:complete len:237 (+) Transcript_30000:597-1307(+)
MYFRWASYISLCISLYCPGTNSGACAAEAKLVLPPPLPSLPFPLVPLPDLPLGVVAAAAAAGAAAAAAGASGSAPFWLLSRPFPRPFVGRMSTGFPSTSYALALLITLSASSLVGTMIMPNPRHFPASFIFTSAFTTGPLASNTAFNFSVVTSSPSFLTHSANPSASSAASASSAGSVDFAPFGTSAAGAGVDAALLEAAAGGLAAGAAPAEAEGSAAGEAAALAAASGFAPSVPD